MFDLPILKTDSVKAKYFKADPSPKVAPKRDHREYELFAEGNTAQENYQNPLLPKSVSIRM